MNYRIIPFILRMYSCKITDWESLGGKWPDNSDPVVVVNTDGRIEVFMVGNDKALSQMADKTRWSWA
jgi:hypothetical protein